MTDQKKIEAIKVQLVELMSLFWFLTGTWTTQSQLYHQSFNPE